MKNLNSLIETLNGPCRQSLEQAAQLCVSKTHFTVDVEHFLHSLLERPSTDLSTILKYYEVDTKKVFQQLGHALDQFKRGNNKTPSLSPHLVTLLERAWILSSLNFKEEQVRSASILLASLQTEELLGTWVNSCPELLKIPRNQLEQDIVDLIKSSPESSPKTQKDMKKSPEKASSTNALDQFTIDLTQRAAEGKIDPIEGRDQEIRQIIDILSRRRQNNPILTGEAGVGKTAIVEGLALRIHQESVPENLKDVSIRALDMGLLEAGAGIKGEFEHRLKSVIEEVQGSLKPIILFIDEAHTLIGAKEKNNDAANLLKPALARGELRTIAATTWGEYKKYFEKDPALTRRFQVVPVREPDEETAIRMLRGLVAPLEKHHGVLILDQAIQEAVRLSSRYIGERRLPDKAVSLLDTACARVHGAQHATPEPIEQIESSLNSIAQEISILEKEERQGHGNHAQRKQELFMKREILEQERQKLLVQWKEENVLVEEIKALQKQLEENHSDEKLEKLQGLRKSLEEAQKEGHLVPLCVDVNVVASVVSSWTGIPLGKMVQNDVETLLSLEDLLSKRLIGQKNALAALAHHILTYRAHLDEPGKPLGVFLLAGPSGVGKTETALALAESLYGGEKNLITFNMSEYQEAHTISTLKGSPPGYVGYGQGGTLTEAVRRRPYSIILLDEIEKAHTDVLEIFYQVFDKGTMEDAEGVTVDFKNTIILMTTNLGTDTIINAHGKELDHDTLLENLRPELTAHFKAALLGRMTIVPFHPLTSSEIQSIIRLKMEKIKNRFKDHYKGEFSYDPSIIDHIMRQCTDPSSGARNIDAIINQNVLPLISRQILKHVAEESCFDKMSLAMEGGKLICSLTRS